ncbi:MAG: hypothetical protein FWG63_04840 [Defluviitaleaceae bacterium]|nr:hypothetical protein [Defluviitaleaceae bacterium]
MKKYDDATEERIRAMETNAENLVSIDDKVYFEKQAIAKLLVAIMSESTSEADWNKRCDEAKAANGGDYPSEWYSAIIESGLMESMLKKWQ